MTEKSSVPPRSSSNPKLPAADLETIGDRLCEDLVDRWRRGERVPVEAYLRQHPELEYSASLFELVLTEVILRQANGESAPLEEYIWRFPRFKDQLRRHFALHERLAAAEPAVASEMTDSGRTITGLTAIGNAHPVPVQLPVAVPTVPGYEILSELGRGGMGVVYKARDIRLGRRVALKFLPAEYTTDRQRLERFLREARTASALNHPHICTVHALGESQGRPFIVMEFIEGETLQSLLNRRPGVEETALLFGQVAQALTAAHAKGVVHRDIKPENIMVRNDGFVKVVDFGLARQLPTLARVDSDGTMDTDPGTLLGTVAYMSPEQTSGSPAESASDIFSLGIVLYQVLTGKHPFESSSAVGMLHAIATGHAVPPSRLNPEIPKRLEMLIEAMLHKEGLLRPTADDIGAAMESVIRIGASPQVKTSPSPIIHRERERQALNIALDAADRGQGGFVCVAGEPGIGKTTLVQNFLEGLNVRDSLIARGHCSERLVGTEAYLPVIDALEDLLRADSSGAAARLMKIIAPTWYSRLARATVIPSSQDPVETARAASQQAMLREFCNFLQEASRLGPVVLFFDDVHWADLPTVDLLAHLGYACSHMRVLVIVTYRPTEMLLGPHAFHRVKQELQIRGCCTELVVGFLSRKDVDRYLALVFPNHALPADFADLIYARTEGSPLFMADLVRYLQAQGIIAQIKGSWALAQAMPDLHQELPESVRIMIQRKLERLDSEDRRLLAAASVQGHEFDSAVVAGTLQLDAADVEECLQKLDQIHGLVRLVREYEFPSRTLTLRYAFVHILYQQALYADLQPTRRSSLSLALARTLEGYHGEQSSTAAAELACLYEVGRDFARAARQMYLAAQNAAQVFAHQEAITLARRGLRLLETLPDTPERGALELPLQTMLGMQLQITLGFAATEARQAYIRARELCQQAPDYVPLFPVLWGLWLFSKVRSELSKAQEMADELLVLARRLCDPNLALQSHQALGMTAFCRGQPAEAVWHVEQVSTLYDSDRHRKHAFLFGQDPSVMCKSYGTIALWLLGYADQALRQSDEAIAMSREQSPSSQAIAMHFAAMLHQLRRDGARVRECSDASTAIAAEHGFSFWLAGGNILGGWSQAISGEAQAGVSRIRQGLSDWNATESVTYKTYYLRLLAEVLNDQTEIDESLSIISEAIQLVKRTGEGLYEAELHRIQGELILRQSSAPSLVAEAQQCFERALAIAHQQQALGLELRAAISAARLARRHGRLENLQTILLPVYRRVTEGFDTPDYLEAGALLKDSR